jgi:hypothetical protein
VSARFATTDRRPFCLDSEAVAISSKQRWRPRFSLPAKPARPAVDDVCAFPILEERGKDGPLMKQDTQLINLRSLYSVRSHAVQLSSEPAMGWVSTVERLTVVGRILSFQKWKHSRASLQLVIWVESWSTLDIVAGGGRPTMAPKLGPWFRPKLHEDENWTCCPPRWVRSRVIRAMLRQMCVHPSPSQVASWPSTSPTCIFTALEAT